MPAAVSGLNRGESLRIRDRFNSSSALHRRATSSTPYSPHTHISLPFPPGAIPERLPFKATNKSGLPIPSAAQQLQSLPSADFVEIHPTPLFSQDARAILLRKAEQVNKPYSPSQPIFSETESSYFESEDESEGGVQMVTAKRISRGNSTDTDGGESVSYGSEGRKMSVGTIIATPRGTAPPLKKISPPRRDVSNKSSAGTASAGVNAKPLSSPPAAPSAIIYTQALMPNQYSQNTKLDPNRPTEAQYLLTLARRTARVSNEPGYGWRLALLEKLELVTGKYVTICVAEEILSIGEGQSSNSGIPRPDHSLGHAFFKSGLLGKWKKVIRHETPDRDPQMVPVSAQVFGVPLTQTAHYASTAASISGKQHDLPIICFSVIEELYRRGLSTPQAISDSNYQIKGTTLVHVFNTGPTYGKGYDLQSASTDEIASLLELYLSELPKPVLDYRVWRLFLASCVDATTTFERRILAAQLILRILPAPNFSLLVYLSAFLSQIILFDEGSLTVEKVSMIFGMSIMMPREYLEESPVLSKPLDETEGSAEIYADPNKMIRKSQEALLWLLSNWVSIADGLVEGLDIGLTTLTPEETPASASPTQQNLSTLPQISQVAQSPLIAPTPHRQTGHPTRQLPMSNLQQSRPSNPHHPVLPPSPRPKNTPPIDSIPDSRKKRSSHLSNNSFSPPPSAANVAPRTPDMCISHGSRASGSSYNSNSSAKTPPSHFADDYEEGSADEQADELYASITFDDPFQFDEPRKQKETQGKTYIAPISPTQQPPLALPISLIAVKQPSRREIAHSPGSKFHHSPLQDRHLSRLESLLVDTNHELDLSRHQTLTARKELTRVERKREKVERESEEMREELRFVQEERDWEVHEAREEVRALQRQLDEIRGVLGNKLGGGAGA